MNLATLREQFLKTLNRSDCDNAQADQFLKSGTRKLERTLRVPSMERGYSFISDGTGDFYIPTDYLELMGMFYNGRRLQRVSGSDGYTYDAHSCPLVYWRSGAVFKVRGIPTIGDTIDLHYYGNFEPWQTDAYETFEMAIFPEAIIYAALAYATDFYVDDRAAIFNAKLTELVTEIQTTAERDDFAGRDLRLGSPFFEIPY